MLTPNYASHALLRLDTAVLPDHIVRLAGMPCPACSTVIRACDTEETSGGVRVVCHNCHRDVIVIEESRL